MNVQLNGYGQPMSNLPPGVTASDIDDHFEPAVPDHDHEWHPDHDEPFILEDGHAVFVYYCGWAETKPVDLGHRGVEYHAVGPECGEHETVALVARDATDHEIEQIETAFQNNNIEVVSADPPDPDRQDGTLVVEANSCKVRYT